MSCFNYGNFRSFNHADIKNTYFYANIWLMHSPMAAGVCMHESGPCHMTGHNDLDRGSVTVGEDPFKTCGDEITGPRSHLSDRSSWRIFTGNAAISSPA